MFRTGLIRLVLFALATLLASSAITAAHASTPMTASGTFTTTSTTFNEIRCAGGTLTNGFPPCSPGNSIIDVTAAVSYPTPGAPAGTLNGTSTIQGTLIFHADGSANFHSVEVFAGYVDGMYGIVTLTHNGGSDSAGLFHATDVIVAATGGLAGLHGVLDEVGTIAAHGPVGTYTGTIQFGAP
jgi:hypothetical protein